MHVWVAYANVVQLYDITQNVFKWRSFRNQRWLSKIRFTKMQIKFYEDYVRNMWVRKIHIIIQKYTSIDLKL